MALEMKMKKKVSSNNIMTATMTGDVQILIRKAHISGISTVYIE